MRERQSINERQERGDMFEGCHVNQELRRFSSAKKLIDSRPRSSTLSGLPVDVSRLPPVPLSIFIGSSQKLFGPAPESAARCVCHRKSDRPLATNRRFPGSHKLCLANPKLSPFRRVRGKS